jgi:putative copper export protein
MLAIIALFLFTKTDSPGGRPAEKRKRDIVYHACGCVIVACLLLVPVEAFVLGEAVARYQPLFWLEAVAIAAFGVAWLVKGQAILKDRGTPPGPADAGTGPAGSSRLLAGQRR